MQSAESARLGSTPRPQIVVITGASAGVGRATARAFAARGAWIGLLARDPDRLAETAREVEDAGGRAVAIPTDVADAAAVDAAAETAERTFGAIDVWINNAMVSVFSPVLEIPPAEFHRVTSVTYLGTVHGTLAALKRMAPRDRGVIVQVGSALAYRGIPLQSAYCAAKHAVQGFCESLRAELRHDGRNIRLTMVQLPAVNTPQFDWTRSRLPFRAEPVPPIYQPEVAAQAIVWAADHDRAELWVGWPTFRAIAGNKLAPAVVDWYLAKYGYDAQQGDEPAGERPDNLFGPVPGDPGAHGRFDDRARTRSSQLWATTHRGPLWLAAAGVAGLWWSLRRARAS